MSRFIKVERIGPLRAKKGSRIDLGLEILKRRLLIERRLGVDTRAHPRITLWEIAAWCGCSEANISQVARKAMRKLKQHALTKGLLLALLLPVGARAQSNGLAFCFAHTNVVTMVTNKVVRDTGTLELGGVMRTQVLDLRCPVCKTHLTVSRMLWIPQEAHTNLFQNRRLPQFPIPHRKSPQLPKSPTVR